MQLQPAVSRMHTYYIQEAVSLSVILSLFEIFQISIPRMKAETLSWSGGWHRALGGYEGPLDVAKVASSFYYAK